jgi:hypothetical protein
LPAGSPKMTRRRKLLTGLIGLALVCVAVALYSWPQWRNSPAVIELDRDSFFHVKQEFNRAAGSVRLIVLLSPT